LSFFDCSRFAPFIPIGYVKPPIRLFKRFELEINGEELLACAKCLYIIPIIFNIEHVYKKGVKQCQEK
jgi:hypothetical protein